MKSPGKSKISKETPLLQKPLFEISIIILKIKTNTLTHLTIRTRTTSNWSTARTEKSDNSWEYDLFCGWKQGLRWGKKLRKMGP